MQEHELGTAMKMGMRRLASGVSVLSARTEHGDRFAMTVSSVTSVSDAPASLLVCVNKQVALEGHVSTLGSHFAVNILGREQRDISNACAGMEGYRDRFGLGDWREGPDKVPYLADAQAVFFCSSDKVVSYGTHHIVIGRIFDVLVGPLALDPLIYLDGGYGSVHKD
jgi:flavin reductase (DIM6/NTAB) family NADH-FMN oxidoreductase RutF